jgi:hypothetical protein
MKDILMSAPILKIRDPDEEFVVFMDACKEGLDGFLSQMIMWYSMSLEN